MARAMANKILISIVATAMLVQLALAVDHSVGSPGGWDTSTNLESWASSQTFTVGDNLVFTFLPNHNVLEVSKEDYDSCSTSGAISSNSLTPVTVSLTDAGSRYFICGTPGHCDQGMKVEIKTEAAASGPPTSTTPTPSGPPTSATPTPSGPPTSTTPSPSGSPTSTTPTPSGSPTTPVSTTSPPPASDGGETATPPSPSSAAIVKMSGVSMMGIGFLILMI